MLECLSAVIHQSNLEPLVTNILQKFYIIYCNDIILSEWFGDFKGTFFLEAHQKTYFFLSLNAFQFLFLL